MGGSCFVLADGLAAVEDGGAVEEEDVLAMVVHQAVQQVGQVRMLRRSGIPLYGAALRPDAMDARQADYSRCALAIGSEGRGLSREVLDLCDKTVLIPMSPRCESLNAAIAAAVLLWESWR